MENANGKRMFSSVARDHTHILKRESDARNVCRGNSLVFLWMTGLVGVPFIFGRPMQQHMYKEK